MKKTIAKGIAGILGITIVLAVIYHLLFGRLFPWSPIQLGFKRVHFAGAVVILPQKAALPEELENIADVLAETEQFHQLQFQKPVKVVLPETHTQHTRFSSARALACALQSGTVVFLSPNIPRENRNRADLLKHELSHALLFQHAGLIGSFRLPEWFREGIAIYYGNPRDGFVGEAFSKAAVDDEYFFNILNAKEEIRKIPLNHRYRFLHSEYRCFMEYLVEMYDIDTVREYMKALLKAPEEERPLFRQVFDVQLQEVLDTFSEDVLTRKWPHAENAREEMEPEMMVSGSWMLDCGFRISHCAQLSRLRGLSALVFGFT